MNSNFSKVLIIIILLCLLILLFLKCKNNLFEKFQESNISEENDVINFSLQTNFNQSQIILNWRKLLNVKYYFVIMYINNDGPFFTNINNLYDVENLDNLEYIYNNPKKNVLYKFSVIGINEYDNLTNYIIKQIKLSFNNSNISRVANFDTKISCNPNGEHIIDSVCHEKNFPKLYSQVYDYDLEKTNNFNNDNYQKLINNLNVDNKSVLEVKFNE